MTDPKDDMLRALRDAYAMERYAERLLRNHATRSTPYPEVNARIEAHLTETLANQKSVASCLERIDGSGAILQTLTDDFGPDIETSNVVQPPDEVVKNLVSLYVFKHQEIASYTSLIAIAEASGFFETKLACEAIVLQQIAMADCLLDRLPAATKAYSDSGASPGESQAFRTRIGASAASRARYFLVRSSYRLATVALHERDRFMNAVSERIPLASLFPWPCPEIVPRAAAWSVSG